jgi:response regulator NasT
MDGHPIPDPARHTGLRLIAADEDPQALERTAAILEGLGHEVTALTASVQEALELVARDDPDAAVVVVHRDHDHALDLVDELSEALSGPVVALVAEADAAFAEAAAQRGLDALASEPTAESLQGALTVAMQRHAERVDLSRTVGQLEHALERRATIERAKGMLMERHDISEREAFEALRAAARSRSMAVVALARMVCEGEESIELRVAR